MPTLLLYTSTHGFGHARRCALLAQSLLASIPNLRLLIRSAAPARLFANLPNTTLLPVSGNWTPDAGHSPGNWTPDTGHSFDSGAVELDPLTIDIPATLARLADLLAYRDAILAQELALIRTHRPDLLLADIPFLIGDLAHAAGLPALALGNFTWDWIYEPFLPASGNWTLDTGHWSDTGHSPLPAIRQSYSRFAAYLRLPFSHDAPTFPLTHDLPLLAPNLPWDPDRTARLLGLPPDLRPRVLLAMRGTVPEPLLRAAAQACPDFLFLLLQPPPPHAPGAAALRRPELVEGSWPKGNLLPLHLPPDLDFAHLLTISDAVISKLGYGLVADAIAVQSALPRRAALLFPPRTGFREDTLFGPLLPATLRSQEIPRPDFLAGRWQPHLHALLAAPTPAHYLPLTGAPAATQIIRSYLP